MYWSKPTCGEECLFIGENSVQKLMIHKAICGFGSRKGPRETKRHRNASMDFKGKSQPQRTSIEHNNHTETFPHLFFANLFFSMAQAPERRVFVDGIPFLMNEQWMRMHLVSLDIRSPTKVFFNRRGQHRSPDQWTQCFLWYKSQEEAEMVAQALDGSKLPGWWRRLSAELARTNPSWQPLDLSEIICFLILCGALFYVGRFKKI